MAMAIGGSSFGTLYCLKKSDKICHVRGGKIVDHHWIWGEWPTPRLITCPMDFQTFPRISKQQRFFT